MNKIPTLPQILILIGLIFSASCSDSERTSNLAQSSVVIESIPSRLTEVLTPVFRLKNPKWYEQDLKLRLIGSENDINRIILKEDVSRSKIADFLTSGTFGEALQSNTVKNASKVENKLRILSLHFDLISKFSSSELMDLATSAAKRQVEVDALFAAWFGVSVTDLTVEAKYLQIANQAIVDLYSSTQASTKTRTELDSLLTLLSQKALEKCINQIPLPAKCQVSPLNQAAYSEYRLRYLEASKLREKMSITPDILVANVSSILVKDLLNRESLLSAIDSLAAARNRHPNWENLIEEYQQYFEYKAYDVEKYLVQRDISQALTRTTASGQDQSKLIDLAIQNADREIGLASSFIESRNRSITEQNTNLLACAEADFLSKDLGLLNEKEDAERVIRANILASSQAAISSAQTKISQAEGRISSEKLKNEEALIARKQEIESLRRQKSDIESQFSIRANDLAKAEEALTRENNENSIRLDSFKQILAKYVETSGVSTEVKNRIQTIQESLQKREDEAQKRLDWAKGPMSNLSESVVGISSNSQLSDIVNIEKNAFDEGAFCSTIRKKESNAPTSLLDYCDRIESIIYLAKSVIKLYPVPSSDKIKSVCEESTPGNEQNRIRSCAIYKDLNRDRDLLDLVKAAINDGFTKNSVEALNVFCLASNKSLLASAVCSNVSKLGSYDAIIGTANPSTSLLNCSQPQNDLFTSEFCNLKNLSDTVNSWKNRLSGVLLPDGSLAPAWNDLVCAASGVSRLPEIDDFCKFANELVNGGELGPEVTQLQSAPPNLAYFATAESWNNRAGKDSWNTTLEIVVEMTNECKSWLSAIKASKYAAEKDRNGYFRQTYYSLIAFAETRCVSGYVGLIYNLHKDDEKDFADRNLFAGDAICVDRKKFEGITFESQVARNFQVEFCSATGAAAISLRDNIKFDMQSRLRISADAVEQLKTKTASSDLAPTEQIKQRLVLVKGEIDRSSIDFKRAVDTTLTRAADLKSSVINELKVSMRESEERINNRSPEEALILLAEFEDSLFNLQNRIRYIQAEFSIGEADRLDSVQIEMQKFLLDKEIEKIRLGSDVEVIEIALKSLAEQVNMAASARSLLVDWFSAQQKFMTNLQSLIVEGGEVRLKSNEENIKILEKDKTLATLDLSQAIIQNATILKQQDLQQIETKRQKNSAESKYLAYKKACESKIDTGLPETELLITTSRILSKSRIQLSLAIRSLEVLSDLTGLRRSEVKQIRDLWNLSIGDDLSITPLSQIQRLRLTLGDVVGLKSELMPKAYSPLFVRQEKIEIPIFPTLTQTEISKTMTDTANSGVQDKPTNRLYRFFSELYNTIQGTFGESIGNVENPIDDDPFEETDSKIQISGESELPILKMPFVGIRQCVLDTWGTTAKAIENIAGVEARKADIGAPSRAPRADEIFDGTFPVSRWYGSRARVLVSDPSKSKDLKKLRQLWVAYKYVNTLKIAENMSRAFNQKNSESSVVSFSQKVNLGLDISNLADRSFIQGISVKPLVFQNDDSISPGIAFEYKCSADSRLGNRVSGNALRSCATSGSFTSEQAVAVVKQGSSDFLGWRPQDIWPERNPLDQTASVFLANELQGVAPLLSDFELRFSRLPRTSSDQPFVHGIAVKIDVLSFGSQVTAQDFDWTKHLLPLSPRGDTLLSNIYLPWESQFFDGGVSVLGWLLADDDSSRTIPNSCEVLK